MTTLSNLQSPAARPLPLSPWSRLAVVGAVLLATWPLAAQTAPGEAPSTPPPAPAAAPEAAPATDAAATEEGTEGAADSGEASSASSADDDGQAASPPSPPSSAPEVPPPAAITPPADLPAPEAAEPTPTEEPATAPTPPPPPPAPEPAPAPARAKLLVMDLKANGVPPELVSPVNAAVQQQATRSFVGEVVTAEQLRVGLDANSIQQLVGCDTENCMSDFGSRVDAKVVLGGNVAQVGDDLLITIIAIEPATGKAVGNEQRKVPQVNDLVFYAARQLTSLALTGRSVDPTVPVRVTSNVAEAIVSVDGRSVGVAPITIPLDPGDHELKLTADDYNPWKLKVTVEEGAPLAIDAALEEQGGFPLWPIALVFTGGAAVFGTTSALLGLHALERRYGTPTLIGLTASNLWAGNGLPVLFDPNTGPYNTPGKNTADLSNDGALILLLGFATDVFLFMTVVSILAAGALLTTDVVLWSLEE